MLSILKDLEHGRIDRPEPIVHFFYIVRFFLNLHLIIQSLKKKEKKEEFNEIIALLSARAFLLVIRSMRVLKEKKVCIFGTRVFQKDDFLEFTIKL